jgi:hypothetical protein
MLAPYRPSTPRRTTMTDESFEIGIDVNPRAEAIARIGMDEATCLALATRAIQDFLDDQGAADQDLSDLTVEFDGATYRLGDLAEVVIGG